MARVAEEIINYVHLNVNELITPLLLRGFEIVSKFELPFFEDKYFNIMYSEEDIDPINTSYIFREALSKDLEFIIKSHMLSLDEDSPASLETLCIIAESLWMVQRQEDYTDIERILTTDHGNQYKFALLVNHLSKLDMIKILETIHEVEEDFFDMLSNLIYDYNLSKDVEIEVDGERSLTTDFFKYLGEQQTVGTVLLREGWVDKPINFKDLINILPLNLKDIFIRSTIERDYAYTALDVLSVLMLCIDSRKAPIDFFREHNSIILGDNNLEITKVINPLNSIYDDYKKYLSDVKLNQGRA